MIGRRLRRLLRLRRGWAVALVLASVLLAGCGVTTQDRPAQIDRDEVPFGLLKEPTPTEPDTTTTTTPTPDALP